jgi:hypothetical protein
MSDRERTDAGTFVETVTLDAVTSVFEKVRGPVITSSDVAEVLGCSTEAARQKLKQLYEEGRVDKRKSGRTTVWWHTGGNRIMPDDRGDTAAESEREGRGDQSSPSLSTPSTPAERATENDEIDAALAGWSHGRGEAEQEASRTVARTATEWLRDRTDPVRKADVPLGELVDIDPMDRGEETIWTQVVREAWDHAVEKGYVTKPSARKYEWSGEESSPDPVEDTGVYDPTEEFDA